jgi:hypothetical protein
MSLFIGPNDFTQPDFTVTWREADGRAIKVGRIFRAYAGVPKETRGLGASSFTSAQAVPNRTKATPRPKTKRGQSGSDAGKAPTCRCGGRRRLRGKALWDALI